jgi:hypothetical protein
MARALKADERSGMFDKAQKHEKISRFFDQFLGYGICQLDCLFHNGFYSLERARSFCSKLPNHFVL